MSFEACLSEIRKAADRDLTDEELDDLLSELQKRQKRIRAEQTLHDPDEVAKRAAAEMADDLKFQAMIERRNAAINLVRRLEALDFVRTQFADDPALGLESLLTGVNRSVQGARASASAQQRQLMNWYTGRLIADMEIQGLWKVLVSGTLDRDIARALWTLDNPQAPAFKGPGEAMDIAKIVRKWQEQARVDANKAGAWIRKMPGYIVRQSHDVYKIRAAGFEKWKADILPRLDIGRTFDDGTDIDKALRQVYDNLASGIHLKAQPAPTGFKGPRNIAKKVSAERVLHFKDADAWTDYNTTYGSGSLREALMFGLEQQARTTGLMRVLGPNPENNFNMIADELLKGIEDPALKQRFGEVIGQRGWLRNRLAAVDGSMLMPANAMAAQVASSTRAVQSMAKLGGAVISAVTDVPVYGSEMRYQGRSMLSGMAEAIAGLAKGRNRRELAEIDGMLGVVFDGMRGDITARFSGHDDLPGVMSRMMRTFFKFNGLTWWTDTIRATAARAMSHRLALNRAVGWAELDPDLKRTLGLYGIDAEKWGIIRQASAKLADGREYVVPEAVREVPDQALFNYLRKRDMKPTASRVAALRDEIEGQLRSYFVDRAEYAVITPDARTVAIMQRGTRPGTVEGELLRFVGQFKSFPVAVLQKAVGREVYGRGATNLRQALRNGNGEMLGLAQLLVWTTLFGYGAMSAKDILKGRTPRDPLDPATWGAAMVQGGGAGIYGDFLFGDLRTRFGGGVVSSFLGPTVTGAEAFFDIIGRLRNGDDTAAAGLRFVVNNTPFANLFYTRIALDYLFLYQVQEAINPGFLRRMEKRVEKENAQTFLMRPSTAIPYGGGSRLLEGVR